MKKLWIATTMIAVAAAPLAYSDTVFTGSSGGSITDAANWDNGLALTNNPGTVTGIDVTAPEDYSGVVITFTDSNVTRNTGTAAQNYNNGTILTFNDSGNWDVAGTDGKKDNFIVSKVGESTINWNSTGSILNGGNFTLGNTGLNGYFNQTAGTVGFTTMTLKTDSILTISGGALNFSGAIDFRDGGEIAPGANYLDLLTTGTTGTVTMAAATLAEVQTFIDNGQIRIDGVVQSDFSGFSLTSDGGSGTVITVIPEPATLGLVMAFGGSIFFIRRKMMM